MTTHKEFDFDDKVSDDIDELVEDLIWQCQGFIIEQGGKPDSDPKQMQKLAEKLYEQQGSLIEKNLYETSKDHPFSAAVSLTLMRQSLMLATCLLFRMEKAMSNMYSADELNG
jgi:hypothetical protein